MTIVMVVMLALGVLATKAEPALNVLGATVQRLSGGSFSKAMLVSAVSLGVGAGMCLGEWAAWSTACCFCCNRHTCWLVR